MPALRFTNPSNRSDNPAIAHYRTIDNHSQLLVDHLLGVANTARSLADKIGLADAGELLGLLHDAGKYSQAFQTYLKSAVGLLNPDDDEEFVNSKGLKGKIDHSTAGAQWVWRTLSEQGKKGQIAGQILTLCLLSHHSGLIDLLTPYREHPPKDTFGARIKKPDQHTHLQEVLDCVDERIRASIETLLTDQDLVTGLNSSLRRIVKLDQQEIIIRHKAGLLVRFLFSCLIDADRLDSANFEHPEQIRLRKQGSYPVWNQLTQRLEDHLNSLERHHPIDHLRRQISDACRKGADREKGIHTLTVPTGGGKTLSSLRFALHHAARHHLDRIFYIIPFTTIIDQNAKVVRDILEPPGIEPGSILLEHHSNLTPDKQNWQNKLASENWDAPIIFTTSVQFLETLFGGGTRGARRMHQLANAVVIFDEIQTLPIQCVHLFNNAINFLVEQCGSSVVLCTATQPLLHRVDANKGALRIPNQAELMPDVGQLFNKLKRVEIINQCKPGGWSMDEIASLACAETKRTTNCLVIVNTKQAAQTLFLLCQARLQIPIYHLSTSMCPAHRKANLTKIIDHLKNSEPILCISTQLIEAGVDVDFGTVVRFMAGLDSIAQAAGRCNRNGRQQLGHVHVVNPSEENLEKLDDIRIGRDMAKRVLDDYETNPTRFNHTLLGPEAMDWYFTLTFFDRKETMDYPVSAKEIGHNSSLLDLLSYNSRLLEEMGRSQHQPLGIYFSQSFMTAGKIFQAIDIQTQGVLVPYDITGDQIINDLVASDRTKNKLDILSIAQQYSVNLFSYQLEAMMQAKIIQEVQAGTGILYLTDRRYYSQFFGLCNHPEGNMEVICV